MLYIFIYLFVTFYDVPDCNTKFEGPKFTGCGVSHSQLKKFQTPDV